MKNIFKIHPLCYVVAFILFIMGYFRQYILFMMIILIHELGHIIASKYYKWKIDKIIILPFGCLIKFSEKINKPIKEEFIISIMGIIFQILFCSNINKYYNILVIIFNLIPIYPLDGYKILNILLNKISSFYYSFIISFYTSFFITILLFIYLILKRDILFIIVLIPLITNNIVEYKKKDSIINKFYLERYLYKFNFKKRKIIKNIYQMKRDYIHIIKNNQKYLTEKEILRNMFDK